MATVKNERDVWLLAQSPRLLPVSLPSNVVYNGDTSGDHSGDVSGTVNFSPAASVNLGASRARDIFDGFGAVGFGTTIGGLPTSSALNTSITLSSSGVLQNAGGGSITSLPYTSTTGGPPINATANFFTNSGSNPSGGSDGDAHWNSSTSTMWFKSGGVWRIGGTINANQITVGTLAAARIASNSITADKVNIGVVSDVSSNAGTITAGTITGSADLVVGGSGIFQGNTSSGGFSSAIHANLNGNSTYGLVARTFSGGGSAIQGISSGGGHGITGHGTGGGSTGVSALGTGGALALNVAGSMTITSSATVANLRAANANNADNATFATSAGNASNATNATNAVNSNELGGVAASGWGRGVVCNVGTAPAAGFGWSFRSTIAGIETAVTSSNNYVVRNISDRRKKFDIQDETLGLDFIDLIQTKTYRMKNNPGVIMHGWIAQDIEELKTLPSDDSLAYTHVDGSKGSDYNSMEAPIIRAIQQLHDKIKVQEGLIEKFQSMLEENQLLIRSLTDACKTNNC